MASKPTILAITELQFPLPIPSLSRGDINANRSSVIHSKVLNTNVLVLIDSPSVKIKANNYDSIKIIPTKARAYLTEDNAAMFIIKIITESFANVTVVEFIFQPPFPITTFHLVRKQIPNYIDHKYISNKCTSSQMTWLVAYQAEVVKMINFQA